ncbi:MAG: hypothetical protein LC122_11795 [Chitinophagales bacterium]|nr:hypothetical protein [Chitinophagales bacterium]
MPIDEWKILYGSTWDLNTEKYFDIEYLIFDGENYYLENLNPSNKPHPDLKLDEVLDNLKNKKCKILKNPKTSKFFSKVEFFKEKGFEIEEVKVLTQDELFKLLKKYNAFISGRVLAKYILDGKLENVKIQFNDKDKVKDFQNELINYSDISILREDWCDHDNKWYNGGSSNISFLKFDGEKYSVDKRVLPNETPENLIEYIKNKKYYDITNKNKKSGAFDILGFTQLQKLNEESFFKLLKKHNGFISGVNIVYFLTKNGLNNDEKCINPYFLNREDKNNFLKELNNLYYNKDVDGVRIDAVLDNPSFYGDIFNLRFNGVDYSVDPSFESKYNLTAKQLLTKINLRECDSATGTLNKLGFTTKPNLTFDILIDLMMKHNGFVHRNIGLKILDDKKLSHIDDIYFTNDKDLLSFKEEMAKYSQVNYKVTSRIYISNEAVDVSNLVFDGKDFKLLENPYFNNKDEILERFKNKKYATSDNQPRKMFEDAFNITHEKTYLSHALRNLKNDTKTAAYNVAATQVTKITQELILQSLSKVSKDQFENFNSIIKSDVGHSLISFCLGMGLYCSDKITDDRLLLISEKLRQNGISKLGNSIISEAFETALPELNSVVQAIPVRVEQDNEKENISNCEEEDNKLKTFSI